jgi:hypothetical protein
MGGSPAALTGRTHFRRPISRKNGGASSGTPVRWPLVSSDAVDPFDGDVIRARRVARVSVRAGW